MKVMDCYSNRTPIYDFISVTPATTNKWKIEILGALEAQNYANFVLWIGFQSETGQTQAEYRMWSR